MDDASEKRLGRSILIALLVLGVLLRIYAFPSPAEERDTDEFYYLQGGPLMLEGLTPGMHYTFGGPETWFGWLYTGGLAARYMAFPTPEERAVPLQIRPYVAVNHATFDVYYNIVPLRTAYLVFTNVVGLFAIVAAFGYGMRRGGLLGAAMLAAMITAMPVIVEHSSLAKPYALGWYCIFIAAWFASRGSAVHRRYAAIFLGIAIASRVELLALCPLLLLLEFWPDRSSVMGFVTDAARFIGVTAVTVIVAAPVSVTNLMGNLRAIATIRVSVTNDLKPTFTSTMMDLLWTNAMAIPLALILVALLLVLLKRRQLPQIRWPWLAILLGLALLSSCLRPTGYGLRHQGPAFLSMLLLLPLAAGAWGAIYPRIAWGAAALMLGLATYRAFMIIPEHFGAWVPDQATNWVNAHVPPGTTVYLTPTLHDPLPTSQSAAAMWDEVSSREAAARKFQAGIDRLSIRNATAALMPAALSEQTIITERSSGRRFFVLGSREAYIGPRFNVRRYRSSAIFGVRDPVGEFKKTGGVMIWRSDHPTDAAPADINVEPTIKWVDSIGHGTYIYISPDLASKMIP